MRHEVTFDIPTRKLGKSDIHFRVKANGRVFGKLEVSKGAVVWFPKDKRWGHKASWSEIDEMMRTKRRYERRKQR